MKEQKVIQVFSPQESNVIRNVTVIGGIPFYKSSGRNSKMQDTWFPFCGLYNGCRNGCTEGFFIKTGGFLKTPLGGLYPHSNPVDESFYPKKLLGKLDEMYQNKPGADLKTLEETLSRFGNFESLCVSAILGGGFWDTEDGKQLKDFLTENYSDDLAKIQGYLNSHPLQQPDSEKQYDGGNHDDINKVNLWLKSQGAKMDFTNPTSPIVDFKYTNVGEIFSSHNTSENENNQNHESIFPHSEAALTKAFNKFFNSIQFRYNYLKSFLTPSDEIKKEKEFLSHILELTSLNPSSSKEDMEICLSLGLHAVKDFSYEEKLKNTAQHLTVKILLTALTFFSIIGIGVWIAEKLHTAHYGYGLFDSSGTQKKNIADIIKEAKTIFSR